MRLCGTISSPWQRKGTRVFYFHFAHRRLLRNLCIFTVCLLAVPCARAGTFTAYGPRIFQRSNGDPVTVTESFSIRNPAAQYTFRLSNGGLIDDEFDKVSSTVVAINGTVVVAPNELNQNIGSIEKA